MPIDTIIIGLGNPFRGDDGIGTAVVNAIKPKLPPSITSKTVLGDMAVLLAVFQDYKTVYLIDALVTGSAPIGTLHRLNGLALTAPLKPPNTSTHAFCLSDTITMAKTLNLLPSKLIIYGLEAQDFSHSAQLSAPVANQIDFLTQQLLTEINSKDNESCMK